MLLTYRLLCADVIEGLRSLESGSVNCCVTSPPYWGLRDYGVGGQIGLEKTPQQYVARMAAVSLEIFRVLKPDGTLWLNLGDCYATGGGEHGDRWNGHRGSRGGSAKQPHTGSAIGPATQPNRLPITCLKPKDLVGIPWRCAFALQDQGWYLRSDIIWSKPNPMPESVTDRLTKAHEYVFLLAKQEQYFYDADAIKEPATCGRIRGPAMHPDTVSTNGNSGLCRASYKVRPSAEKGSFNGKTEAMAETGQNSFRSIKDMRNKRSVWEIATQPYPEAHFAVMPEALVEPCILAGCPEGGTVLDPFAGSGTVGVVALKNGRNFVGIDLNPDYVKLARDRIGSTFPMFATEVA